MMTFRDRVDDWLNGSAPAERLAMLRVLISGFVVIYLVANVFEFQRLANRGSVGFEPVGVAVFLSGPLGEWIWVLFTAAVLSGAAATVGLWYRITGPAFAVLVLLWSSYHSSWGQMLHFEHLFTLHLLVLGFSPSAVALVARAGPSDELPSARFGWPVRIMAIITVSTYVIAGLAKLRIGGAAWLDGSTLGNHIGYSATRMEVLGGFVPPLAPVILRFGWLLGPMAVGGLFVELLAPLGLFGGSWRRYWVLSVITFHTATALTMMVWFPYQGLGFALLPLYRCEPIGRWVDTIVRSRRLHPADP